MRKMLVALAVLSLFTLSACYAPVEDTSDTVQTESSVPKAQHMTHDETQTFDWKCDIAPAQIKIYKGSPLEGYFVTTDGDLYAYNAQEVFADTDQHYRKVETDLKIAFLTYHYQMDKLTVLTEDFKTYSYDREQDTFVPFEDDFGSVVEAFSKRGIILSWGNTNSKSTTFWFLDEKGNVFFVEQDYEKPFEYRQTLKGTIPTDETILSTASGVVKTASKYYCYDSEKAGFYVSEEATAAYDTIAYVDDLIVLYKDDPTHIYDHKLVYQVEFVY